MHITPIRTKILKQTEPLVPFLTQHVKRLSEGSILVITSKIVALSLGNIITESKRDSFIKQKSKRIITTPWADLTLTSEGWCINAGVDESNANGTLIPLPEQPFEYAQTLLKELKKIYKVRKLGVIITDTRSVPLRVGTVGRAIGCAGFHPTKSYVGKKDLYGRKSRVTVSNVADALAAGAVVLLGEGNEQTPLAIIENAPVTFTQSKLKEYEQILFLLPEKDIFTYVYKDASPSPHTRSKK